MPLIGPQFLPSADSHNQTIIAILSNFLYFVLILSRTLGNKNSIEKLISLSTLEDTALEVTVPTQSIQPQVPDAEIQLQGLSRKLEFQL